MSIEFNPVLFPITNYSQSVTIPNGLTTSGTIDMQDLSMVGLIIPAAFTGITMTFLGSPDNVTFYPIYNTSGTQLSITVATSRIISFTPGDFAGMRYVQLVSGSAEAGNRIIQFVLRSLM